MTWSPRTLPHAVRPSTKNGSDIWWDPQQKGKFVVIDVYSGDYEVHKRDADATRKTT